MPNNILIAVLLVTNILFSGLCFILLTMLSEKKKTVPGDVGTVDEAKMRAQSIIDEALKDAQMIQADAELEENTVVSAERLVVQKIEKSYEEKLSGMVEATGQALSQRLDELNKRYDDFMNSLQRSFTQRLEAERQQYKNKEDSYFAALQEKSDRYFESLGNRIDVMLTSIDSKANALVATVQTKLDTHIDNDVEEMKKAIGEYKLLKMKAIDDQAVGIMEAAIEKTLAKRLSLSDHVDLVHRAIDEAKKEGIFSKDI